MEDTTQELEGRKRLWYPGSSKTALQSPTSTLNKGFDNHMANWRMESIMRDSDSDSDNEEFFDCQGRSHSMYQSIYSQC